MLAPIGHLGPITHGSANEHTRALPDVPTDDSGTNYHLSSGYDWLDELDGTGWVPLPAWGTSEYDLGSWPTRSPRSAIPLPSCTGWPPTPRETFTSAPTSAARLPRLDRC